jgi:glycosyltransferase involved in cell wall biosynthesis
VEFLGELDRRGMVQAVNAADAVLLMSAFEGSPNILLEAMAAGRPVVATAIGGVTELIDTDVSGILVQPGDVDAAARALQQLAASEPLRHRMGLAARAKIEREHTIEGNIDAHIAVYDRVLAASNNGVAERLPPDS